MTFDDVIQAVKAKPGQSFTGLVLRADGRYLSVFTVPSCEDDGGDDCDPEWTSIQFEGGLLFSSSGEGISTPWRMSPRWSRSLIYRPSTSLPEIAGLCSEYVLHKVFPQLPNPEGIWGDHERRAFVVQDLAVAKEAGFFTITGQI
ncbi:hypothetical protein [Azotobacter salinestris]|uniref:hypothetical protein n=1 Tax=Azotobacter salinestris TaxID=69964 RepID=UPI001266977B|nr:hypothetical protein [Azotobacter salinestris]